MILPILLAIVPALVIMIGVYILDKYDREPLPLLGLSFLLGMCSVLIPLAKAYWLDDFGWEASHDLTETALFAFVGVGFVEEFAKFLMLMLFIYRRPAFDEPFDGIVYAVFVGMGFASVESVWYVLQAGELEAMELALGRMFTATPAHGMFAVIMGYFLGIAKTKGWSKILFLFLALLVPTLFHGSYDFFLMQERWEWMSYLSILAFAIGLVVSRRLMKQHLDNSPFRKA